MERYVTKENKKLKYGFTTGSAATLATKAALSLMVHHKELSQVTIMTPKGWEISTPVEEVFFDGEWYIASIIKDAGDDPDVTHGTIVTAKVRRSKADDSTIDGGYGVGRITKPGLQIGIGQAAINPVPRQMIQKVIDSFDTVPVDVVIEVPEGERLAKKTFNPQLGIIGGISIIGTTGIVEPMSKKAIVDTIITELKVLRAQGGHEVILVPGNHGLEIAKNEGMDIKKVVKISNFVGDALDACVALGYTSVVMVGHIGKFAKVALGIFHTHSKDADGRMASMIYHLMMCDAPMVLLKKIQEEVTVEGACQLVIDAGYDKVFDKLCQSARNYVIKRTYEEVKVSLYMYSFEHGVVGRDVNGKD